MANNKTTLPLKIVLTTSSLTLPEKILRKYAPPEDKGMPELERNEGEPDTFTLRNLYLTPQLKNMLSNSKRNYSLRTV
jgi:hypothetical protein